MDVYMISRDKYIHDLSGAGAKAYGGRWNKPGTAALYTSEVRSLALLELIVHFNSSAAFNMNYYFVCIEIDESKIMHVNPHVLPENLSGLNLHSLWNITESYFSSKELLGIKVPSIIVPKEYNFVLNPLSFYYNDVRIAHNEPAVIDARLNKLH